jgi:hypothetical protein
LDVAAQLQRSGAQRRTSGVRREQSHPLRQSLRQFSWAWIRPFLRLDPIIASMSANLAPRLDYCVCAPRCDGHFSQKPLLIPML